MPQPSPDTALLSTGWERNAETDEYRLAGSTSSWLTHDEARALAFPPDEPETPMSPETSVILLLVDILKELRTIGRALGSQSPLFLRRADVEHQAKMDAIAKQAEAAAAQKGTPHE